MTSAVILSASTLLHLEISDLVFSTEVGETENSSRPKLISIGISPTISSPRSPIAGTAQYLVRFSLIIVLEQELVDSIVVTSQLMNEYFFETMHHEFGHILDNNKLHPTTFNLLSNGHYNAAGWSDTPDSVAAGLGFVSPYASASYTEDWVETLGRYITRDSITMEKMMGTAEYEWEIIDLEDKNGDGDKD